MGLAKASALAAASLAFAGAAACNEILGLHEGKPEPTTSGTGGAGGTVDCDPATTSATTGGGDPWSCIGGVKPLCSTNISYIFDFTDNDNPATGITVSVCKASDDACTTPVMSGLSPTANGTLGITLPSTFAGFLYAESANYKPAIVEIGPPTTITPFTRKVPMFGQDGFSKLLGIYGIMEDPARGSVGILALDCDGNPAAGVTFVVSGTDGGTTGFYFNGILPDKQSMQTDSSGFGGFVNVKPTPPKAVASAYRGSSTAFGKQTIHVRPQTFTFVYLGPTPN